MERDFENTHDLDDLSDDEIRGVVLGHLRKHGGVDVDSVEVRVEDGIVILGGRLGTEAEARTAERIVTDTIGLDRVESEIVVDRIRRPEAPEAIDDAIVAEEAERGLLLGDRPSSESPEVEEVEDDLDARLFGTTDVRKAIADGTPWIPPQSATPEGLDGTDGRRVDEDD